MAFTKAIPAIINTAVVAYTASALAPAIPAPNNPAPIAPAPAVVPNIVVARYGAKYITATTTIILTISFTTPPRGTILYSTFCPNFGTKLLLSITSTTLPSTSIITLVSSKSVILFSLATSARIAPRSKPSATCAVMVFNSGGTSSNDLAEFSEYL